MAEVEWIKLTTDMFNNKKIKYIRTLPEGNEIVLIWVMLLTLAGRCNTSGMVFLTENIPYTTSMLAEELKFKESTVILAINVLQKLGMIEFYDENLVISNWEEYQNIDGLEKIREQTRKRVALHREKKKLLSGNATCNVTVTQSNATEEEKEEDIDNNNITSNIMLPDGNADRINYNEIVDLYNSICVSFPRCRTLSDKRKKAIKARLNKFTVEEFKIVFTNAENSDFLKGSNNRNWSANFDWLIQDANFTKTLEGNYQNTVKKSKVTPNNKFHNFEQRHTDYNKLVADYYGFKERGKT